jgi:hypothetical protein
MSTGRLPIAKPPDKLIVLWAFDRGHDGELLPAWDAREMPDERRAVQRAREIAHPHAGVIAWSREVNPAIGEYGPSQVLFRHGAIPDLD